MGAFRDRSIRPKLQLMVMITVATALAIACGAFLAYEVIVFRNSTRIALATLVEVVEANCATSLQLGDAKPAQKIL